MKRVVLESPYAGDIEKNTAYARRCMHDCLQRGEAPIASHLLYTQPGILREEVFHERELGIDAGFTWMYCAELVVFYTDNGISHGMAVAMEKAAFLGIPIELRTLKTDA